MPKYQSNQVMLIGRIGYRIWIPPKYGNFIGRGGTKKFSRVINFQANQPD